MSCRNRSAVQEICISLGGSLDTGRAFAWLGEEPADEAQFKVPLAPYLSDGMICGPVSPRVGNVKNNDPSLIEPVVLTQARRDAP